MALALDLAAFQCDAADNVPSGQGQPLVHARLALQERLMFMIRDSKWYTNLQAQVQGQGQRRCDGEGQRKGTGVAEGVTRFRVGP